MKFGIITFPGSNCDDDTAYAVVDALGATAIRLWHKDHDLQDADVVILPGGFAHGDALRAGAIARFSPSCVKSSRTPIAEDLSWEFATGFRLHVKRASSPGRCCATPI